MIGEDEARRAVRDEACPGERPDLLVHERRVGLHRGDVLPGESVDDLRVAGADVRESDVGVDDRADDDLVEVRKLVAVLVLAPPVLVLLERVVIVLHGLGQDERAAAGLERLEREIRARRFDDLAGHDHPGAIHQRRQERREGGLEVELHGARVGDDDAVDRAEVRCAARLLRRAVAVDVPLHEVGVEACPVVELHVLA